MPFFGSYKDFLVYCRETHPRQLTLKVPENAVQQTLKFSGFTSYEARNPLISSQFSRQVEPLDYTSLPLC